MSDSTIRSILSSATLVRTDEAKSCFRDAKPFRHVALNEFFTSQFLSRILMEFPTPHSTENLRNRLGQSSRKHVVENICKIGPAFQAWDAFLKSKDFIQYLEEVSGIRSLIHDPEYHGAGTHNNFDGQGMLTHIDFNHHPSTGYHRRLNLIIYLNDEWDESWGGHLELHKDPWDPENDWHVSYPPIINNAVLFETNEVSWHGFNIIRLPEGKKNLSRKSLTVYYYTKERPENEVAPKHSSIFAPRLMPPSIKPGELITNEQFLELEDMLTRNVKHIRGIYGFRENLLMQIEGYKRKIRQYESHLVLRTVGQAIQVGGAKGISADGKLLDTLQAVFRPLGSVSAIKIHLRVPEFIGANAFDVSVNGESFALHADEPGVHAILCCLHAECTKEITISVACGRLISPNEVNGSPDKQCFGAIINYVEFIP